MNLKHGYGAILRETQQNETEEKSTEHSTRMLNSFNWSHWKRRDKEGLGTWWPLWFFFEELYKPADLNMKHRENYTKLLNLLNSC